ncbi:hypothetical protein [Caldimonas tepidiphila]|uniref:hypothetical protein n=1 Tax=Caldimonas tepidiphila TaxID=2315841 RepID=UPI001300205A|nr:hypothetical protein [Caldimonas tepidiphila]
MSNPKDFKYTEIFDLRRDYAEERVKRAMTAVCDEFYSIPIKGELVGKAQDCFSYWIKEDPKRYLGGRDPDQWRHVDSLLSPLLSAMDFVNEPRERVVYYSGLEIDARMDLEAKGVAMIMAEGCVKRFAPAVRAIAVEIPVERHAQLEKDLNMCVNFFIGACDKGAALMGKIGVENDRLRAGFCVIDMLVVFYAAILDWAFALRAELPPKHGLRWRIENVREDVRKKIYEWRELLIEASSLFAWRRERAKLLEFGRTHGGIRGDIAYHFYTRSSKW